MKITFRQDLVGALVFLILSISLWLLIPYQIMLTDDDEIITAQTFPRLVIGLMGLCSLILLVKELIKWFHKQPVKMVELHLYQEARTLIVIGLLILYWAMFQFLPFMIASIIFSVLLLLFFRCKNWIYYAIVISVVLFVSFFFQYVLNVSLP